MIDKVIYRTSATATGGRDGTAHTQDGSLDVKLFVVTPNVMPLFGSFNPQVSARFGAA
jgi:organic hydroperoxide reductase OsmC/OhrA